MGKHSRSWIENLNIAKMSVLSKEIYRFNTIPISVPKAIFADTQIHVEFQGALSSKSIF